MPTILTGPERKANMNPRWLVSLLLLFGVSGFLPALHALDLTPDNPRPSHRDVNADLADNPDTPDRLAERLRSLAQMKRPQDQAFQKDFQQLAKLVAKDPQKWENLLKGTSSKDWGSLKQNLQNGDPETLEKLLQAAKNSRALSDDDKALLQRLGEKFKDLGAKQSGPDLSGNGTVPDKQPTPRMPAPMPKPKPQPEQSPWKRLQSEEWLKNNLDKWAKDLDNQADSPWGKSLRSALENAAANPLKAQAPNFGERARGLTRFLPRVSSYLPRGLLPKTSVPRLPSLPRLGGLPRAPGMPSAPGAATGKALLWLAVFGVLALVLWRGGWWQRYQAARAGSWRLGPWPVLPQKVATRADLVRAFEHLALLCLGPMARVCHHLELGGRIAEQPAGDPDRRRAAAHTLARLYEQARYTPDDEPLQPEMMASARRELCYLAGVVPT